MTLEAQETPPPARVSALNMANAVNGGSLLGVVAKRTYQLRGARFVPADEQVALVEALVMNDDTTVLLRDLDVLLGRTHTDVIVLGNAYGATGQTQFDAAVRVGKLERTLRVFGDRTAYRDAYGQLRFSEPKPVEQMALAWTAAYGGADEVALKKYGDPLEALAKHQEQPYLARQGSYAYPRNRAGKGYLIDASAEGLAACALPNLEDPADLLTPARLALGDPRRWPAAPRPAATGFLSYNAFPRCAMLGLLPNYDFAAFPAQSFPEVQSGLLSPQSIAERAPFWERMSRGVAQASAPNMRVAELEPNAAVELSNIHPHAKRWSFSLPDEVPRMAVKLPDAAEVSLTPKIRCCVLEPELDRLCITWVGEHTEPTPIGPGKFAKTLHNVRW